MNCRLTCALSLWTALAVILVAACTGGDDSSPPVLSAGDGPQVESSSDESTMSDILAAAQDEDAGPGQPEETTGTLSSDISALQEAALSDGIVTFSEYEAALLSHIECAESEGLSIFDLSYDRVYGQFEYLFSSGTADPEESRNDLETHDRCYEYHVEAVEFAWTSRPSPGEEELAAVRPAVASCLNDYGIDVSTDFLVDEALQLTYESEIPQAVECLEPLEPWT